MHSRFPELLPVAMGVAVPFVFAVAGLWAVRRYLRIRHPPLAFVIASLVVGIAMALSGVLAVESAAFIALAPAIAMIVMQDGTLSAIAWLRGAATLAVALTVVSAVIGPLMTTIVATATAGGLCWLCAAREDI